ITRGECLGWKSKQCNFYHPDLCWQYLGQGKCNSGNRCVFRHIQDSEEKDNKPSLSNSKYRKAVCRYWVAGKCQNRNCNFTHPVICREILRTGQCNLKQCNSFHPQICNANGKNERCKWGDKCRFLHIKRGTSMGNYQQQNRESNKRENPKIIQKYNIMRIEMVSYILVETLNTQSLMHCK
ncbi:unnamed protein product, partial [Meganyctiphanes norvegica]